MTGHWLLPEGQAERSYAMLNRAMTTAGKVGITKFVRASREYLAALRPVGNAFCLSTMHFADEVMEPYIVPVPVHGETVHLYRERGS